MKTVVIIKDDPYYGDAFETEKNMRKDGLVTVFCPGDDPGVFIKLSSIADEIHVLNSDLHISDGTAKLLSHAVRHGIDVSFESGYPDLICPCCRAYFFSEKHSYEICPVCGWEDDPLQKKDPDFAGGANILSLNEARKRLREAAYEENM